MRRYLQYVFASTLAIGAFFAGGITGQAVAATPKINTICADAQVTGPPTKVRTVVRCYSYLGDPLERRLIKRTTKIRVVEIDGGKTTKTQIERVTRYRKGKTISVSSSWSQKITDVGTPPRQPDSR